LQIKFCGGTAFFYHIRKYKISDLRNRHSYWRINLPFNAVAHLRKTSIEVYLTQRLSFTYVAGRLALDDGLS
jgi:hypothetical protein